MGCSRPQATEGGVSLHGKRDWGSEGSARGLPPGAPPPCLSCVSPRRKLRVPAAPCVRTACFPQPQPLLLVRSHQNCPLAWQRLQPEKGLSPPSQASTQRPFCWPPHRPQLESAWGRDSWQRSPGRSLQPPAPPAGSQRVPALAQLDSVLGGMSLAVGRGAALWGRPQPWLWRGVCTRGSLAALGWVFSSLLWGRGWGESGLPRRPCASSLCQEGFCPPAGRGPLAATPGTAWASLISPLKGPPVEGRRATGRAAKAAKGLGRC